VLKGWRRPTLWVAGITLLAVSLGAAVAVDLQRIAWQTAHRTVATLVRAEDAGLAWDALADAGIWGVAVRASSLAAAESPSLSEIRRSGLEVALVLDAPSCTQLADLGPFPLLSIEETTTSDDPLLLRLLAAGTTLILPESSDLVIERSLWEAGHRQVVRAHEIPPEDLASLSLDSILARWGRAVGERGVRCIILSAPRGGRPEETESYYEATLHKVRTLGYAVGKPALPPPAPPRPVEILLHLGVSALLLFSIITLFPSSTLALPAALGYALLPLATRGILLNQIDAFATSVLVPVLAAALLVLRPRVGWGAGARAWLLCSLSSVAGGLLVAALLADPAFLFKLAEFRGVKAALLLPPVAALILYCRGIGWARIRTAFRSASKPLLIGGGALFLFATGLLLLRTGTVDALVSGLESRARGILETLLVARPRFKEFLLGHPFLLAFGVVQGADPWRGLFLFFGLIGQTSILNTFAHAHTPLVLSLFRTGNGFALGLVFGAALCGALTLGQVTRRRRGPSSPSPSDPRSADIPSD